MKDASRVLTLSLALSIGWLAPAAAAPAAGEVLEITAKDGSVVRGKLIAETSRGYLIDVAGQNVVVLFEDVERAENSDGQDVREDVLSGTVIDQSAVEPAPVEPAPVEPGAAPIEAAPAPVARVRTPPPRPRQTGLGMIIPGWVMVGTGSLIGLLGIAAPCGDGFLESDCSSTQALSVLGFLIAASGGVLAAIGHGQREDAFKAMRAWDKKYGKENAPKPRVDSNSNVGRVPASAGPKSAFGLSFTF